VVISSSEMVDNMIKCPTCGSFDCIRTAEEVLDSIYQIYMACPDCRPEPEWDTTSPVTTMKSIGNLSEIPYRCPSCQRRSLNAVMAHVLFIMIKHGDRDNSAGLVNVGTPLITQGFPIMYPPRLGHDHLVLLVDNISQTTADQIIECVPEIKGVVLRTGAQTQSVGILDSDSEPHEYTLLAGCDVRCDIAQSDFGELVIYKSQSKIHIEFDNTYKMKVLGSLNVKGLLAGRTVVDGMCGPGTLGLMCILSGAKKVIFNDAWRPAVENLLLNIVVNKDILGVEVKPVSSLKEMPLIGNEPVLAAKVKSGDKTTAEVYFGDLRRLLHKTEGIDVCLIDTFPSADPSDFIGILNKNDPACRIIVI
jgi:hypothetical protein